MSIFIDTFGRLADGTEIERYTLQRGGITLRLITYAAAIQSLEVPDKAGNTADIMLGYDTAAEYETGRGQQGSVIGRHANRLEGAEFELNGVTYKLAANNGRNNLHGGPRGFARQVWNGEKASANDYDAVRFTLRSPDGQEGFPGNLVAEVVYRLDDHGNLSLDYYASTDQDTIVNLTNHGYFNLAGHNSGSMEKQMLQIPSDFYTPVNAEGLTTGEIRFVEGTALDFRQAKPIGRDIADPLLENVKGYDHNFVVPGTIGQLRRCAVASDPDSGRKLEVWTTMPGLQLYTANTLPEQKGKAGSTFGYRSGFCLETQYFPNSMHLRHFPSPILRPDQTYHHTTVFRFKILK